MFLPEPTRENPYESGAPEAPLVKRVATVDSVSPDSESVEASDLDLSKHEAPFAWPEGTREVDELGRDLFAVTKGRLEGQQRRHREVQRANWRRGHWRHIGEGLVIGAFQLGAFSMVVHSPWSWGQQPVLALAGAFAMGIASVRRWGPLETSLIMTLTWVGLGIWVAEDALQAFFVALLSTGVISTSKFIGQGFEDPLR
ncbi:MAG: hypothetical protein ACYS26_15245 [Planctomycetota bacterium]|jgi:hypothetical protein